MLIARIYTGHAIIHAIIARLLLLGYIYVTHGPPSQCSANELIIMRLPWVALYSIYSNRLAGARAATQLAWLSATYAVTLVLKMATDASLREAITMAAILPFVAVNLVIVAASLNAPRPMCRPSRRA